MPIKIDPQIEAAFGQVVPSVLVFLIDILRHLHLDVNIEDVQISNKGTSLVVVLNSVENVMAQLSPEHQNEIRDLARAFGERLLQEIDAMIWIPKIENGKVVAFRRKVKRFPR